MSESDKKDMKLLLKNYFYRSMHYLIDIIQSQVEKSVVLFSSGVGGILPVVLIAPNDRQSANSNQL